jgi:hypothetical protein
MDVSGQLHGPSTLPASPNIFWGQGIVSNMVREAASFKENYKKILARFIMQLLLQRS